MKSLNIVVFGLSLRVANELKNIIVQHLPRYSSAKWGNIASKDLDILFVSETFYDVPSIKHLINNQKISVLKVSTAQSQYQGTIEQGALYWPLSKHQILGEWLAQVIAQPIAEQPLEQYLNHDQITVDATKTSFQEIEEILNEIQNVKNGKMQIFDSSGVVALVDPRSQWVWRKQDNRQTSTDLSLNYTYATNNDSHTFDDIERQDMKNWLWNLLWHSPSFMQLAPASSSFHLDYWPQPEERTERRDILRMAACFTQGADTTQVASHLDLPKERVRQFVAASVGAGYGRFIKEKDIKYRPNQEADASETNFMKKLFGGLRRRLGF